ncbi:MAG: UDP-N-acetylmuramoyl-L-alanine--D-glutamate ligase [Ignavibacteriaceae bacterium]|nr:UDP-N-acetylmuramoyl-L-alanine--D-glutamate ligase [Ignavibacteriaceae bacterium]
MKKFSGKKITILGAGRSGVPAALLAKEAGAVPFVSDLQDETKLADQIKILKANSVEFETGVNSERVFDSDIIIKSPGIPDEAPVIAAAREKGIKIISEIEFAAHFNKGDIFAITGTNGKTTVTSLIAHIFNNAGIKCRAAGNIGLGFSDVVKEIKKGEPVSLEVSSFQLDNIEEFKPKYATILNITPDHLDRYGNNFENYVKAKYRIFENHDTGDLTVLNYDDPVFGEYRYWSNGRISYFSLKEELQDGAYLKAGKLIAKIDGRTIYKVPVKDVSLIGEHNYANILAVMRLLADYGLPEKDLKAGLKNFPGVEHRIERVESKDGIIYINDSKATNVDSVWYALRSFEAPIYLILGGKDKGNDYNRILEPVKKNVKKIYAIGSSRDKVYDFFKDVVPVEICADLEECVKKGHQEASKGEIVMLSPACASFDMFNSYEHRGKVFKELVKKTAG